MMRQEVLSLLERYPEFFDGDDELLHDLITESHPEPAEKETSRAESKWKSECDDRPAKNPR